MKANLIIIILLLSGLAFGQNLNEEIDALMNEKYQANEPGATALITKGGKQIYRKAFGMASLENNVTMTPEHVFEIGSITKQFTVVLILMLMEQGKLSLEDPITKFIENYPMHGHVITVHHLLTHTSGIKSYTSLEPWTKLWRNDMSPMEMIDLFKGEPMDFAPGDKFLYNNSAYFMLGYIIEKASGIPYPEFLEKNIFEPLGMNNSFYGSHSKIIKNRALGYQKGESYKNAAIFPKGVHSRRLVLMPCSDKHFTKDSILETDRTIFTWEMTRLTFVSEKLVLSFEILSLIHLRPFFISTSNPSFLG